MSVVLYAIMLLVFRVVSLVLILDVIKKQRLLKKRPIRSKKAAILREEMYRLAIIAFGVNIIPIVVDVLTVLSFTTRPNIIHPVSVLYMFSYAVGTLLLTSIIWRMYRDALK